jgi:uncharacterized RDD family membrane protein YckC
MTQKPAERGARLAAALLDLAVVVGVLLSVGLIAAVSIPVLAKNGKSLALDAYAVALLLIPLAVVVLQFVWLTQSGQTIGKRAMKVRIVKHDDGENGGFVTNVLLRCWLNALFKLIPLYALVDALFIFRDDRRCLHDLIAGTLVVEAPTDKDSPG